MAIQRQSGFRARTSTDVLVAAREQAARQDVLAEVCQLVSSLSLFYLVTECVGEIAFPTLVVVIDGWGPLSLADAAQELEKLAPSAPKLAIATDARLPIESALDAGFDDCVIWPVRPEELRARIHVRLRRTTLCQPSVVTLDPDRMLLASALVRIKLTTAQFKLLQHLLKEPDSWIPSHELTRTIAGARRTGVTPIANHVHALRKKLGQEAWRLQSERALGYRFDTSPRRWARDASTTSA